MQTKENNCWKTPGDIATDNRYRKTSEKQNPMRVSLSCPSRMETQPERLGELMSASTRAISIGTR